jgi:hypothetical protein
MNFLRTALIASSSLVVGACSHPLVNQQRHVEVQEFVRMVECELVSASNFFPNELNNSRKDDKWDIGTTLDLTLVSRVDADGKVTWAIPLFYTLSPSAGGYVQDTVTAHVVFSTNLLEARKNAARECWPGRPDGPPNPDPSGTGLGLAAWIRTSFNSINNNNLGGLSYTRIFELRAEAGARFGYVFAPINLDVGAGVHGTKTNQIVVGITPHSAGGPTEVIIVGDTRGGGGGAGRGKGSANRTSAAKTFSNQNLNMLLQRQAPLRLLPGQTLPVR